MIGLANVIMSWVPWWVYALAGVVVYLAILRFLSPIIGDKWAATIAMAYALAAGAFVLMDYGGDARERWVRAEWAEASRRAELAARARDAAARKEAEAAAQAHAAAEDAADQKIEEVIHAARQDAEARASAARRLSADDIARLRAIDRHAGP